MKITLSVVAIVAKFLPFPIIYAILWGLLCPTKLATTTKSACKFVSHNVTPPGAFIGFIIICTSVLKLLKLEF
jgi:hypothetical protein